MKAENQFHLGIVAEDCAATKAALTAVFGCEWGVEVGGAIPVTLPTGERTLELRCSYSLSVPRLEVLPSIPGTMWEPATGGIHHVGYWSDDVDAEAAELVANGYATEATRTGEDGKLYFAFLRSANGFRIELVSRAAQAGLERYWGGAG